MEAPLTGQPDRLPVVCPQHGVVGFASSPQEAISLLNQHDWSPLHTVQPPGWKQPETAP